MTLEEARDLMVSDQLAARGIDDQRVLAAMRIVPRHLFVDPAMAEEAYADHPLPIGFGQTISQPFIVALMSQMLQIAPGARVLELGTGSGYQAAVLAELGAEVFTIERIEDLAVLARTRLGRLGYEQVHVRNGDGNDGWPGVAPFDAIIVTAAVREVPRAPLEQLAVGGRMVLPLGESDGQELAVIQRTENGLIEDFGGACRFVPFIGRHGWEEAE